MLRGELVFDNDNPGLPTSYDPGPTNMLGFPNALFPAASSILDIFYKSTGRGCYIEPKANVYLTGQSVIYFSTGVPSVIRFSVNQEKQKSHYARSKCRAFFIQKDNIARVVVL